MNAMSRLCLAWRHSGCVRCCRVIACCRATPDPSVSASGHARRYARLSLSVTRARERVAVSHEHITTPRYASARYVILCCPQSGNIIVTTLLTWRATVTNITVRPARQINMTNEIMVTPTAVITAVETTRLDVFIRRTNRITTAARNQPYQGIRHSHCCVIVTAALLCHIVIYCQAAYRLSCCCHTRRGRRMEAANAALCG